jgi:hypothetical protein
MMKLAPAGTPLWHPTKADFAPRLGVAFSATPNLVFRAGAGTFYDLGYADIANGTGAFPYATGKTLSNVVFPVSAAAAAPPAFSTIPPVPLIVVIDPHHGCHERTSGMPRLSALSADRGRSTSRMWVRPAASLCATTPS